MKKFLAIVGTVIFLGCGLSCWNVHDARYQSSFRTLEEFAGKRCRWMYMGNCFSPGRQGFYWGKVSFAETHVSISFPMVRPIVRAVFDF